MSSCISKLGSSVGTRVKEAEGKDRGISEGMCTVQMGSHTALKNKNIIIK
jgi:hypothetical protein